MSLSRRGFVKLAAGSAAGLMVSFYVPAGVKAAAPGKAPARPGLQPNAFVRIGTDDSVTVVLAHSEMGQGIWTGLAMLIAEELECDWAKVRCEHAPAAPVYGHPAMGLQMTGGSSTTNGEFERYRTVGAMARDMLVRAAAARWKLPAARLTVAAGRVKSAKGELRFGELAEAAMKLAPPAKVTLKDPKDWKLIGTRVRRLDSPEKITGQATFGIDVQFPGLRTAVVLRPPAFGAKLQSFDAAAALKIPGVEQVVEAGNGVAVIAAHFWAAKLGRDAVVASWSTPDDGGVDSDALVAAYRALAKAPGAIVAEAGKVEEGLAAAARRVEAEYDVPYLSHSAMEPLNCTVKIDGDRCEIWTGTQFQTVDQGAAARILGIAPTNVTIHTTFLGGGFGRRANPASDFVSEAVLVARAAQVPVKVVWTREDDTRGGFYRPIYVHRVRVGLDGKGAPVAWDHVVVGQSILTGTPFEAFAVRGGVDGTSVEGVGNSPYIEDVAARRVSLHSPRGPVPVLWWRSVGNTHTAFAVESMIDELAHAAGADPLAYRLERLADKPRFAAALKLAAEKAGWGTAAPAGHARGLAVHESFGSIIAECAEVSVEAGRIRVHEVTCAVDCGTVVNPLGVEAQIQGSIAYGLSAALHGKLTLRDGRVQESNFHDYPVLRMHEMPRIAVHLIHSGEPMGGIGEPATAPIAPAVANAVFALTRKRLRSLPLRLSVALALMMVVAACGGDRRAAGSSSTPGGDERVAALAAFETVRGVLQHPRCQNCHPAGDQPLQGDAGLPHNQNIQRGPTGHGMVGAECTTCHGPANPPSSYGEHTPPGVPQGWHMPPPEQRLVFVGVPAHELCEQVKDPARNGGKDMAALRVHLDDPLVTWGWDPGLGRTPVATPRAEFLAAWEHWAAAGAPCPDQTTAVAPGPR